MEIAWLWYWGVVGLVGVWLLGRHVTAIEAIAFQMRMIEMELEIANARSEGRTTQRGNWPDRDNRPDANRERWKGYAF